MANTYTVNIIGAGVAGLAASVRLAAAGHKVQVYEANSYPGGKLSLIEQDGYRFDAGPSLFTMPHLVDDLYHAAGLNPQEHFRYQKLDIACKYFYHDGTVLNAYTDRNQFGQEVEDVLGVPATVVASYLQRSEKLFNTTGRLFLEKSLHRLQTYVSKDVLGPLANLHLLGLFSTMHQMNEAKLKHPKLVQLFNRYATYNGSSPYLAPGVLNLIPHLEHNMGTFFPEGSMHAITTNITKLAQSLGVQIHLSTPVKSIALKGKTVTGIQTEGGHQQAQRVVSNMDVHPTYRRLLPSQPAPEKTLRQQRSSSALIFYWGVGRSFPELKLHNIFFGGNYKAEFNAIFADNTIYQDPTIYVNITSKHNPADAPEGCENWFVMINVPCNNGQNWAEVTDQLRQVVIKRLSAHLSVNLASLIRTEAVLTPEGIEQKTASYMGALYGTSSNNRYSAFLRHPNFTQKIKGLYFCGGSVHPGGGIPLCLLSAKIVADIFA